MCLHAHTYLQALIIPTLTLSDILDTVTFECIVLFLSILTSFYSVMLI